MTGHRAGVLAVSRPSCGVLPCVDGPASCEVAIPGGPGAPSPQERPGPEELETQAGCFQAGWFRPGPLRRLQPGPSQTLLPGLEPSLGLVGFCVLRDVPPPPARMWVPPADRVLRR